MKKPNITPGPWNATKQDGTPGHCMMAQVFDTSDDELYVASMRATDKPHIATSNAKAISAVPDMLDELIEEINFLHEVLREYGSQELASPVFEEKIWDRIKQIEQALKKAGCTDE